MQCSTLHRNEYGETLRVSRLDAFLGREHRLADMNGFTMFQAHTWESRKFPDGNCNTCVEQNFM